MESFPKMPQEIITLLLLTTGFSALYFYVKFCRTMHEWKYTTYQEKNGSKYKYPDLNDYIYALPMLLVANTVMVTKIISFLMKV
jgi:hypothetical protein